MLSRLKNSNPIHLIIAFVLIFRGADLWVSSNYFFWPPMWASILNDDLVGFIGVLIGGGLVWWSYDSCRTKRSESALLGISSAWMTLITMVELGHVIFAGYSRMIGDVITDIAILMMIWYCAKKS